MDRLLVLNLTFVHGNTTKRTADQVIAAVCNEKLINHCACDLCHIPSDTKQLGRNFTLDVCLMVPTPAPQDTDTEHIHVPRLKYISHRNGRNRLTRFKEIYYIQESLGGWGRENWSSLCTRPQCQIVITEIIF